MARYDAVDRVPALSFVRSKMFTNLFAHGMELVEDTATYLDTDGRTCSQKLDRSAALNYAGVSMRLTTKLMQIASWLLVLRAIREGEMSFEEVSQDKYRLTKQEQTSEMDKLPDAVDTKLPSRLLELVDETNKIYMRIVRLDRDLFTVASSVTTEIVKGDAASQLRTLRAAFAPQK